MSCGPKQISDEKRRDFEKQGYRVVGSHSVVKVCEWTKKALKGCTACYKSTFYGIQSWRCVEMSPTWFCDHRCVFCWRDTKFSWPAWTGPVDEPKDIVDGCIDAWKNLLVGFKGNEKADKKRYEESLMPLHFAISLTGEPTMYPKLPELIEEIHRRGMSTFLVTNGTIPDMIEKLAQHPPTQLYVSVYGPNEEVYRKTADPLPKDAWQRLQRTFSLLPRFPRKTIRLTLTKGWNMVDPEGYALLLKDVDFDFLELKGYVWVGHSRERLEHANAPSHEEILEFGRRVAAAGGWTIVSQRAESRVILLMKDESKRRMLPIQEMRLERERLAAIDAQETAKKRAGLPVISESSCAC